MEQPDWYADWRHEAVHELMAKNKVIRETYKIDEYERYDYDLDRREIVFSHQGKARVVANIQLVGTTSESAGTWLWAWANESFPADVVEAAEAVRQYGVENKIEELTTDSLRDDSLNGLGWELAAVTARIAGAMGAYRPPRADNGHLFLLYMDMRFVS